MSETIVHMSQAELDYHAEQAREAEEQRQREADGLRRLAVRFDADPNALGRCARILATLASDWSSYWNANDVVCERSKRCGDGFDTVTVDLDLVVMCEAGLVEADARDNGDDDAPPSESWTVYAVRRGDIDDMLALGTERWMTNRIESALAEIPR